MFVISKWQSSKSSEHSGTNWTFPVSSIFIGVFSTTDIGQCMWCVPKLAQMFATTSSLQSARRSGRTSSDSSSLSALRQSPPYVDPKCLGLCSSGIRRCGAGLAFLDVSKHRNAFIFMNWAPEEEPLTQGHNAIPEYPIFQQHRCGSRKSQTRRFITVLTKSRHLSLSWPILIQFKDLL